MSRRMSISGIQGCFLAIFLSNAFGISIDCPNLVIFAQGLGMQFRQPAIWTSLQGDCCTAGGVTCDTQRVTQINWPGMGLNGNINGTALPSGMTQLYLYLNQLNGSIPALPSGLTHLNLGTNKLTGNLPFAWPSGLTKFIADNNQLTGNLPAMFPIGLNELWLHINQLNGSIPSLSSGLQYLYLGNNKLTGNIPSLPSGLTEVSLYTNQLTGNIPILPSGMTQLYLYANQLSGSIPALPSGLTHLNLGTNKLTGNLPFAWPSGLTIFIADNNQLTGNLPAMFPIGLNELWLDVNQLTGNLPNFPSSLQYLSLRSPGNQFTGTLRLNQPTRLFISGNRITDLIIADSSQLWDCDLSNNPLLGNPNIVNLSVCTMTGLYSSPNTMILLNAITTPYSLSKTMITLGANKATETIASIKLITETKFSYQTTTAIQFYFHALVLKFTLLHWILMGLRILISSCSLAVILVKTPWAREWKNKRKLRDKVKGSLDIDLN